ncbi:unnamed protein product [Brassica rapa]|uniref:Uncharacterized protein n=1 Tax=Brassica campestris TaxID=3711 RepID=A0A8D9DD74_BRACM|nr:unnamed protein product [Brassica rapa]
MSCISQSVTSSFCWINITPQNQCWYDYLLVMECVMITAVGEKDGMRQIVYQRKVRVTPSGSRRGPSKGRPPGSPKL